jgi:Mrp family chromosome partitioning ATPase/capsular polysaccharide biosynthesis protein
MRPSIEPLALERYLRVLRERWKIIVGCLVVCVAATALYLAAADPVYEAEADLLVSPIPRDAELLVGLGLIQESSDPTRDVETVSRLMETTAVARRAKQILGTERTPRGLLNATSAEPVAQSNIVAVTAEGSTAREAQQLANAFARAIVDTRSARLSRQVEQRLERLTAAQEAQPDPESTAAESLALQINALESLRGGPDPTIRVANFAELPTAQVSPRPLLSIGASIIAGLVLGLVAAFALDTLDPRLRREEQLRRLTRLPILARIPNERHGKEPLRPERLSPGTIEAYRTLRATLSASRGDDTGSRSILVTGAAASEGKTTTAINLATSLAFAGHRVILIEADLRRPSIGPVLLGTEPAYDIMDVVLGRVPLEEALEPSEGPGLEVLLAKTPNVAGTAVADGLFLPTAGALLDEAKRLARYVIIDSPPLTEVIDGLALAERADDVLLVTRLGRSHISKIVQLGELLARHGIEPIGFAVVGVPASEVTSGYYATGPSPQRRTPRPSLRS